jgi:hypothetical protein
MPLITHEESCRLRGLTPDVCAIDALLHEQRRDQARELCGVAFPLDDAAMAECSMACATPATTVPECAGYARLVADHNASQSAQHGHIAAGIGAVILLVAAFLLGKMTRS